MPKAPLMTFSKARLIKFSQQLTHDRSFISQICTLENNTISEWLNQNALENELCLANWKVFLLFKHRIRQRILSRTVGDKRPE